MATTPNRSWPTPDDTDLVRDGAAAIRALGDAIDGSVGQGFVYAGTRYYTSSGTFEKADPLGTGDIGLRAIRVQVVGGGGGGGGCGAASTAGRVSIGGGGGGGGYSVKLITDIAGLDASETITIGSGGSGGIADSNGGLGGQSSAFGLTANGGSGGIADTDRGLPTVQETRPGGVAANGDLNVRGTSSSLAGATSTGRVFGGAGGASFFGGGGNAGGFAGNGDAGQTGGGGGGAAQSSAQSTTATRNGGAGGAGIVVIDCFV